MIVRTVTEPSPEREETEISGLYNECNIPKLPLPIELETRAVMKKTKEAARALAELKGVATSMPNQEILINALLLQEAKDSSEIENIITTHDELLRSDKAHNKFTSPAAKEVYMYTDALEYGYKVITKKELLTNALIKEIQSRIVGNNAGFRTQSGTKIINEKTRETIYLPPQKPEQIVKYMDNLEQFINTNTPDPDPLVKMAIIHHQFESVHPFYDGNGRTGRIINILYLVQQGLLDAPILYLSRYINHNKLEYYRLLQAVHEKDNEEVWIEWILFMLEGINQISVQTIDTIKKIKRLMASHKKTMRDKLPKIYSQDLLNNIFSHPYTKAQYVAETIMVSRPTATKYLDELESIGLLSKRKSGRDNYYQNDELYQLLVSISEREIPASTPGN